MDKLAASLNFVAVIATWLEKNVGAGAAFAVLCLTVFLSIYLFRKIFPNGWIWLVKHVPSLGFDETPILEILDKVVQTLPGTAYAAVLGAIASGGSIKVALLSSLAGPLMTVAHHILQAIPWIPYLGKLGKKAKPNASMPPLAGGAILLLITGCNITVIGCTFAKEAVWPAVAECVPDGALKDAKQEAVDAVQTVLLGGAPDWKDSLGDLGKKYGPAVVVCIADKLLSDWGSPSTNANPRFVAARGRAQDFLKSTGTKVEK